MSSMTISQALRSIKRVKGKIAELRARATASVSFDQSRPPVWDFAAAREELVQTKAHLLSLEAAVAVANATTTVHWEGKDVPLAWAIRMLQEFKDTMSWLAGLNLHAGSEEHDAGHEWDMERRCHVSRTKTVTFVSKLAEQERAAQVEQLRESFEKLNDAVEAANHKTPVKLVV